MMHERISLNGAPVVGFGEGPIETMSKVPLVGIIVGASAGGLLGYLVGKNIGGIVGALLGGVGGTIVETEIAKAAPATPSAPATSVSTPTGNADTATQMAPGQMWTAKGAVRPTIFGEHDQPWGAATKSSVQNAVVVALAKVGLTMLDGHWVNDYTFTIAMTPTRPTTLTQGTVLPLSSGSADQVTFSNIAQAPVKVT